MNLSDIIKTKRNEIGISQNELATRIHVDSSYIAKIESNITKKPSIKILYRISNELEINYMTLLQKAGYSRLDILELTSIGIQLYVDNNAISKIGLENLKEYVVEDKDLGIFLDIEKILKKYKNDELSLEDTVELLDSRPMHYRGTYQFEDDNNEL